MADSDITISAPIVSAHTGASAFITLHSLTIEAEVYAGVEEANITLPSLVAQGRTGATAIVELPGITASGTSISGVLCTVDIVLGNLVVTARATSPVIANLDAILPSLSVSATAIHNILANADITLAALTASGITTLSDEEIIGYALNLPSLGLSSYDGYNFNSFARIGNRLFGAADGGLYLLEGTTDNGKMIDAYTTFPLNDMGVDNDKRLRTIYYSGSADGMLRLHVTGNESTERRRDFTPNNRKGKVAVPIGRDEKAEWWQIKLSNVRGADFEMNSLESFNIILGRGRTVGN